MADLTLAIPASDEILTKLTDTTKLPVVPALASQILELINQPNTTSSQLSHLIEKEPSIAAQVMRYARSSFYGYRGSIDTIEMAITRVLGFDIVGNMALGMSLKTGVRLPKEGPLGVMSFWRHAIYTAALAQELGRKLSEHNSCKPGTLYLSGLLSHIGVPLLYELYPDAYNKLNEMLAVEGGEASLYACEQELYGYEEDEPTPNLHQHELGSWLLKHWQMPTVVNIIVQSQYRTDYQGDEHIAVKITQLAECLYEDIDENYPKSGLDRQQLVSELNLNNDSVYMLTDSVEQARDSLDDIVSTICSS